MNPCEKCALSPDGMKCDPYFVCSDLLAWVFERVEYERHADSQEPEPLYFRDDDREV